ncbi:XRE family transcriptional regulator [Entomomonas sp. E2T0]|uniref:XRE family transcriptional regulator n=1 Tax=Entomomonas sp. E2T0 TaxID=2930213 RepID=UPI0039B6FA1A
MMQLKDRIKQARKHAKLSQKELADKIGITQPSLSELETGKSQSTSYIASIARACGVDAFWLESGQDNMVNSSTIVKTAEKQGRYYHTNLEENTTDPQLLTHPEMLPIEAWDDNTPLEDDETEVPFLKEVELAAGSGKFAITESHTRTKLRFGKSTLRNKGINPNKIVCVTVKGNSMEPVILDGATVGVDTENTAIVDGKIYAIAIDDELLRVKLLYRLANGQVRVRSFNREEYEDETYDLKDIKVLGRVFWYSVLL